jgi:hypothetical protein
MASFTASLYWRMVSTSDKVSGKGHWRVRIITWQLPCISLELKSTYFPAAIPPPTEVGGFLAAFLHEALAQLGLCHDRHGTEIT